MEKEIAIRTPLYMYIDDLEARRYEDAEFFSLNIDDWIWNKFIERIEELADEGTVVNNGDPARVVDDFLINGSYGEFDEYKEDGETDEDFIHRVQDEAIAVNPEKKLVIFNFYSV